MSKQLTKAMLEEMGIKIEWDEEKGGWNVQRYSRINRSPKKSWKTLKEAKFVCKHKYASDKVYPGYAWCWNGKQFAVTTGRLIYAYFKGDVLEGCDVDHIDNNPFNNILDNLQVLTREENLAKRYADNPNNHHNQWDAMKDTKKGE